MKHYKEVVLAWKFNDIFYALSVSQCSKNERALFFVVKDNSRKTPLPLQEEFDDVYSLNGEGVIKGLISVFKKTQGISAERLFLSNPILVINQWCRKRLNSGEVVMVEDGLMNYFSYTPSKSKIKKWLQLLLRVSNEKMYQQINETYLLLPEAAKYFFGTPRKLNINYRSVSFNKIEGQLEGKRVFVGMPLYKFYDITISEYNQIVNAAIKKHGIDYYLPHLFASEKEHIECTKIDLANYACTFEMLAKNIDFSVYSFGSSILYTTKLINNTVRSYFIDTSLLPKDSSEFLKQIVDQTIVINKNEEYA